MAGVLAIEYVDRWLAADRVQIPHSMSPPLATKKHTGAKVANYLWNLLPDNDQTLQKWGQIYGVSPNSAFALLSKVGEDCAGAIQIVTDEWMVRQRGFVRGVQWTTRRRWADRLKRQREEMGRRDRPTSLSTGD
ncbi:HipA N-terminal domain-containing protein [Bradyrhizobium zhanjiangense]|uniref:HipA N-terminal subdomain 1 domain-containing protein n=1 Tax=Bradyrhizobium zhanjiangense TaxID=1325107 RepID=A0ABY0DAW6_9BRAD|nr:HipA N-terminal domain-containing protein [Bradyrhizobium zhanjiangense]RXG86351.1 hypothetical protein EAS62_37455 [Bradyrhizobium zhanjiangense]